MKDANNKKHRFSITRDDIAGYLFLLPFLIGFVFFFLRPMAQSVVYSFSKLSFSTEGMHIENVGLENFNTAFFGDADFIKKLVSSVSTIVWQIPVIMFVSMFLAILLNGKFTGRLFFRTAMFLPVIFSAAAFLDMTDGTIITTIKESRSSMLGMSDSLQQLLIELTNNFGFPDIVVKKLQGYVSNIFDVSWKCGIQIILYIIGLQAIPDHLYEVCKIEGATAWETFWKVTFPLLTPTILLCLIYTIIDLFNSSTNLVMSIITENMIGRVHYACAQTWIYTVIVIFIVFLVYQMVSRRTIYLD